MFLSLPPAEIAPSPWTMHRLARSAVHFTDTWSSFTPMSECTGRQRGHRGADADTWRRGTCLMIEGCFNRSVGWKSVRLAERLAAKTWLSVSPFISVWSLTGRPFGSVHIWGQAASLGCWPENPPHSLLEFWVITWYVCKELFGVVLWHASFQVKLISI